MGRDRPVMPNDRRKPPPRFTVGNALAILSVVGAVFAYWITDHDSLITVKAAQFALIQRDGDFRQEIREALADLKKDIRELRDSGSHVRWRDLPPSPHQR